MIKIGFIGVGNMGGALARAAAKNTDNAILLSDFDRLKAEGLAAEINARATDNNEICKEADYIFLGVKPQVLPELLKEISPILSRRDGHFTLVSMAAGVKIKSITDIVGNVAVIRIMPNLPVSVGEGMILYSANSKVFNSEILVNAMGSAGIWDRLDEEKIDIGCAVSGCGPAFAFMFASALAKGGEADGLSEAQAIKYAAQTLKGAAQMLLNGGDADALTKAVCSPGGATIEGVKNFRANNFDDIVRSTIKASYNKTIELGR